MRSDDPEFEDELAPADEWEEFRYDDSYPIGVDELKRLDLAGMPDDIAKGRAVSEAWTREQQSRVRSC